MCEIFQSFVTEVKKGFQIFKEKLPMGTLNKENFKFQTDSSKIKTG